jgi:DNA-directed RNA polymerase II subunit RPB1
MGDTEIYSWEDRIKPIDRVEFSILGNEEIKRMSALGSNSIDIPDLYEKSEPKQGGLIDHRMGTSDNQTDCLTCGLNNIYCVGHFGHIALAEPVFHIDYIQYTKKVLSCVCLKCSKLLVYKNENEIAEMLKNKTNRARMTEIKNLVKNIQNCRNCGTPVSKIKLESNKKNISFNLVAETSLVTTGDNQEKPQEETKKKNKQNLTPDIVYDILKNISDIDCLLFGMDPKKSRPENMINKIFPVPPIQIRPSVKADFMNATNKEDDLTIKLADIVKANNRIKKQKETMNENTLKYSDDNIQLLQYHVATCINNETSLLPPSEQKGKTIKSLASRLKGKEGRFRFNLQGKRIDFSARTVITSDPSVSINELGVPIKIATNLTFPEVVTPDNIEQMRKLVRNGRDNYPGANFVFKASNMIPGQPILPIDLKYKKEKVDLRYGDIVERHLINGDIVLLNRQPTLHKQSMMAHRIRVINDPNLCTFRLSVSVTLPYNADLTSYVIIQIILV